MPTVRVLRQSFAGGEVTERMFGRMTVEKFQTGVEVARNFITLAYGSAMSRPGTRFVRETKTSSAVSRLIPFVFSTTQAFAIELGGGYFRFHALGGTIMSGPSPYEISNPYAAADVFDIRYVQSGDVITLTHPNYAPRELKRLSNTNWTLTTISFASTTAAPTGVSATATQPTGGTNKNYTYKVTALNSQGFEESLPSTVSNTVSNDLTITGNYNTVTWGAVSGAAMYNVYKSANGAWGYIGQTAALSMVDDNIIADMSRTPPVAENPFTGANKYPTAVGYFEQRRFFGGSLDEPMNVWSTQSGSDYNMNYTIPSQDSDALRFKIKSNRSDIIRHIVAMQELVVLTAANEQAVKSPNSGVLTPATIAPKVQTQVGASNVQPVLIGNRLLFESAVGGHVFELRYDWQSQTYQSDDVALLAEHLFDRKTLKDCAYSQAPWQVLWCTSSDGRLLGMTYVPSQEVLGWHHHTTDGEFESCCTIRESGADMLYMIVKRTINGSTKRYVEVLDVRDPATQADAFFVDCGLTYSGAAATTISGLGHLEGKTVSILGDGGVMPRKTVSGGQITLDHAVTKAQIGLPIDTQLKTLPVWFQDPTLGQGHIKNVNQVWARVKDSGPFWAGPDEDHLTLIAPRSFEAPGQPPALKNGEFELVISSSWNAAGQVVFSQPDPLPLEIVYIVSEVAIGG